MYHSISDRDRDFRPFYQTNTAPETFRQQMQFLHDNKYPVVSLEKLAGDIISGRAIEPGTVVLTFDDGEVNFYTAAFPVLREFGFPATVFLTTGAIDNADKSIAAKYLTWDQVRELRKQSISFGSHTVNHLELSEVSQGELEFELRYSKQRIEAELDEPIDSFAYPFAFPEQNHTHVKSLMETLARLGYKYGVSTRLGRASARDNIFCLRRLPLNSWDDGPFVKAKVDGAYDWLYVFQVFRKYFGAVTRRKYVHSH